MDWHWDGERLAAQGEGDGRKDTSALYIQYHNSLSLHFPFWRPTPNTKISNFKSVCRVCLSVVICGCSWWAMMMRVAV